MRLHVLYSSMTNRNNDIPTGSDQDTPTIDIRTIDISCPDCGAANIIWTCSC